MASSPMTPLFHLPFWLSFFWAGLGFEKPGVKVWIAPLKKHVRILPAPKRLLLAIRRVQEVRAVVRRLWYFGVFLKSMYDRGYIVVSYLPGPLTAQEDRSRRRG